MVSTPPADGTPLSKKWWWALSLLGLPPILVFGFWMLRNEASEVSRGAQSRVDELDEAEPGVNSPSKEPHALPGAEGETENVRPELAAAERAGEDVEEMSPEAEREQSAIDRFDQNARDFDERMALFENEQSSRDGETGDIVTAHISSELSPLGEDITVTTECTPSVCVVQLTSGRSVGSLLASTASWLRRHPEGAIGDPADPDDDQGMRISFFRNDAPGVHEP